MRLYQVLRRVTFQTGENVLLPLALYDDEAAAKKMKTEVDLSLEALLPTILVNPGPNGQAKAVGLNVAALLGGVGIKDISTEVVPVEVQGQIALPDKPKIVLARN